MKLKKARRKNQTVVEYILIITLVAVASITVLGIFSDRIRTLIAGAAASFGADPGETNDVGSSVDIMKKLQSDGSVDGATNGN